MDVPELTYNTDGLIPCIVQDADTREVLMMAWMNEESLALTMECGETVFWSRSRRELWHKGATSGNTQKLVELRRRVPPATRGRGAASSARWARPASRRGAFPHRLA